MHERIGNSVNAAGTSVLVVDDEPDLRLLVRIGLERSGYRIVGEASDGHEALDRFYELDPDSMVIDLAMPRVGGIELIKQVRATSSIPLVGYSAAPTRDDERELLALGVPLVMKDAGVPALLRVLDAVMGAA